jgi:hypothetical protein
MDESCLTRSGRSDLSSWIDAVTVIRNILDIIKRCMWLRCMRSVYVWLVGIIKCIEEMTLVERTTKWRTVMSHYHLRYESTCTFAIRQ